MKDKSKVRYDQLRRYNLLKGLHVLCDILRPIQKFQKLNQGPKQHVVKIMKDLENMKSYLEDLKTTKGAWELKFDELYDAVNQKFMGHVITKRERDESSVGNFKRDYLTSVIRDLESRVYDLNEEVKSFVLITDMTAEKSMEEIQKHSKILCSKFSHWNLDEADLIDKVLDLKETIKKEN